MHSNTLNITVSILPQKYFIEQIAKDKVNVNVMVRAGYSPTTYEPQASQMKQLVNSKAYFSIGVPFESVWLDKFKNTNRKMLIIDTAKDVIKQEISEHNHNDRHNHKHKDTLDPHIWLDPILVKIQIKNIHNALVKLDGKNEVFYTKNYNIFLTKLDSLDEQLQRILLPIKNSSFLVFHPTWGYFASRYGLKQIAIEKKGKEPKPKELIKIINVSKKHNLKAIFISPQFTQKSAKTIAKHINAKVIPIDSLAYEYDKNLIDTAAKIYNSYTQ